MKQRIPITISIAAIISASICAIATASAQTQFSTFTGPNGKFSIGHPSDWLERQVVRPPSLPLGLIFTSPNDMHTNVTVFGV
jgi:hypothetical protein